MNTHEALIAEARGFIKQTASDFSMSRVTSDLNLQYEIQGNAVAITVPGFKPVMRYEPNPEGGVASDLQESLHSSIGSVRLCGENAEETKTLVVAFLFHMTQLVKMREALGF